MTSPESVTTPTPKGTGLPGWVYGVIALLGVAILALVVWIIINQAPTKAVPPAVRVVSIYTAQNAPVNVIVTSPTGMSTKATDQDTSIQTLADVPVGSTVQVQVAAYSQFDNDDIQVACNIKVGDKSMASQTSNGHQDNTPTGATFPSVICIAVIS